MSAIQEAFQGHVQYQFTTLKVTTRERLEGHVFKFCLTFLHPSFRTCETPWRTPQTRRRRRSCRATRTGEHRSSSQVSPVYNWSHWKDDALFPSFLPSFLSLVSLDEDKPAGGSGDAGLYRPLQA